MVSSISRFQFLNSQLQLKLTIQIQESSDFGMFIVFVNSLAGSLNFRKMSKQNLILTVTRKTV
jgi:hypothetical protein